MLNGDLASRTCGRDGAELVGLPSTDDPGHLLIRGGVAVVIPTYRARKTIYEVVEQALKVADFVIVVDDACPEKTGDLVASIPGVHVIRHLKNTGVGGATKTGLYEALRLGARYAVKVDADGQMDSGLIPAMVAVLERSPEVALVKGNRFAQARTVRDMPVLRLIGNSCLTLLVKISSGYWTIVDPTNGFIALRMSEVSRLSLEKIAERYFFEIDLLCSLGVNRLTVAEFEMRAIYNGAGSSLSILHTIVTFPGRLLQRTIKRIFLQYFVFELNVGSLCLLFGLPLVLFAIIFGTHEWAISAQTGIPRTTGTVILALLTFVVGFQLLLQALLFDVQYAPRTIKVSGQFVRIDRSDRSRHDPVSP